MSEKLKDILAVSLVGVFLALVIFMPIVMAVHSPWVLLVTIALFGLGWGLGWAVDRFRW